MTMLKSFFLFGLSVVYLSFFHECYGQGYSIDAIPDSLMDKANAVVIKDEGEFEVINDQKAILRNHTVIAVLNSKSKRLATISLGYDKLRSVNKIEGVAYDSDGKVLEKSKNSSIEDFSATSGGTLFDDNRVRYLDLKQNTYPYIVEFWTEQTFKTTYFTPDWPVIPAENVSVMYSSFTATGPTSLIPNFKVQNWDYDMIVEQYDEVSNQSIKFSNLRAIKREPYGPSIHDSSPVVYSSPGKFKFDGYEGDFNSWKSIGVWQNELNKGRDDLSPETIKEIKELTDQATSSEEKIRLVYQYVQERTRYVSIQLGIGGYQPFPASHVEEYGYGDCKALTNYTQTLLKAVDVASHYTWVYGGNNPPKIDREFPIDQFNHIILCVPNEGDTLWLECTSQTNPMGYLGNFTGDRDVLIVTEDGGEIVHTPTYNLEDNKQVTTGHVSIDKNYNGEANLSIDYHGLQYENGGLDFVINDGDEKLKEWVYKNTDISNFRIVDFSFALDKSKIPSINEQLHLEIESLVSVSGDRVFLTPNLMNKWKKAPKKLSERKTDIILSLEFQDVDSITYDIPVHYSIEHLPKDVSFASVFGSLSVKYTLDNNRLIYVRKVRRNKGRFPKEKYEEFRGFYKSVIKADKAKVVFLDKT